MCIRDRVPGISPWRLPEGAAWIFPPHGHLVLDTHFRPSGRVRPTTVKAALHLRADAPTTPVAMVRLVADQAINLPPGRARVTYTDAFELPVPVRVERVMPHAHYLCRDVHARAVLPAGETIELIRIPDWDFQWHDFYRYAEPIELPAGTRVEMEFTFDNSAGNARNPWDPPRRVLGGPSSIQEMAVLALLCTTCDEAQRAELARATEAHNHDVEAACLVAARCYRLLVRRFDANGDSALDADEERAASAFLEAAGEQPEMLRAVFDLDHDGALSAAESAQIDDARRRWRGDGI